MLENILASSVRSVKERPSGSTCFRCVVKTEPLFTFPFPNFESRWFPVTSLCDHCCQQHKEEARIWSAQKDIDDAFKDSRMWLRFQHRTFENFVPEPDTQKAYEVAQNFRPYQGSLFFLGACCVGKTHLAAAIANRELGKTLTLFLSCQELL